MSVFKKLSEARIKLQESDMKKSGSGYNFKYFELSDFLPRINQINAEIGLCAVVSFSDDACLTIYDVEASKDINTIDAVEFRSPMSESNQKNNQPVQNLGAVQTYLRRYLYMNAYEIVEHDALDSTQGKEKPEAKPEPKPRKPRSKKVEPVATKPSIDFGRIEKALAACIDMKALRVQHDTITDYYKAIDNLEENKLYTDLYDLNEKRLTK